jgi:hypothetical protein
MSRSFPTSGGSTWRRDWLADDAVHSEPVSAPNSLLTGKNTGKFAKVGPSQRLHCLVVSVFRPLWPSFPKQSNREFWARKQGSYCPEQGSHSAPSGPSPASPRALAVLRSRTVLSFIGPGTGRSPGFSPPHGVTAGPPCISMVTVLPNAAVDPPVGD